MLGWYFTIFLIKGMLGVLGFFAGRKDGSILRNIDYPAEHDCFLWDILVNLLI